MQNERKLSADFEKLFSLTQNAEKSPCQIGMGKVILWKWVKITLGISEIELLEVF
jgi:hypothetical protein